MGGGREIHLRYEKIFIRKKKSWPSICSQLWFKTTAKYQQSLWKIKTDILKEKCMKVSSKCCIVLYKAQSMYALQQKKNFNTFYFNESVREFLMWYYSHIYQHWVVCKENRIYILERNLENLSVWIFSVPFSLKESSKCTNQVNVYKLYAVEYINTVCALFYPFEFRIFQTENHRL